MTTKRPRGRNWPGNEEDGGLDFDVDSVKQILGPGVNRESDSIKQKTINSEIAFGPIGYYLFSKLDAISNFLKLETKSLVIRGVNLKAFQKSMANSCHEIKFFLVQ